MRNPALLVVFPIRWPNICASAAATNRRCRSFRYQLSTAYFLLLLTQAGIRTEAMTVSYNFSLHSNVQLDRKSTRLNSSHGYISYAVFCLKKKKKKIDVQHT